MSLTSQIENLLKEKEGLSRTAEEAQNQLHALNKELSDIKAKPFNWTYKPDGDHFQCYVDGQKIGVKLNCKQHASCNNLQLNRAICALRYSGQVFD